MSLLEDKLARVPDRPGVYLYRDGKQQVLYVGKAASLRSRVRSYFQESRPRDPKTDALVRQVRDLEYIVTDNELEALMLEANLVRKHRPRYNIILRDDKHYPFLKLTTNEAFPRLLVARRVQRDGAHLLRSVLSGHRDARDAAAHAPALPAAHVLDHDRRLGSSAPASSTRSTAATRPARAGRPREGYAQDRAGRRALPRGPGRRAGAPPHQGDGGRPPAELKFERAAVLRDQIQSLNKVRERQKIISTDDVDQDVIGVVRQGSDACVELFFVRKGRLVGQEPFFFDRVAGWSDGEILSAFVRQFYGKTVLPAPGDPPLRGAARGRADRPNGSSTLAGRRVQLHVPQRGAKRAVRGHGRGERRHRAPEPPALARQPPAARPRGAPARARPAGRCPTASRATTSPTSRGPSRSARWWSGRTAA